MKCKIPQTYKAVIYLIFGIGFNILISCVPNNPRNLIGFDMDLNNKAVQEAFEAGYKHSKDTLFQLMRDENPTIRYIAVNAFSSWPDTTALDSVAKLLKDPEEKVRIAAAYTLGQIRSSRASSYLTNAFVKFDSLNDNAYFNSAILEALGKCGDLTILNQISSVKSYLAKDSVLTTGLARGIFRFAQRNIINVQGKQQMYKFLSSPSYNYETRLYAANYFGRLSGSNSKSYTDSIIGLYNNLSVLDFKIPLINAITKGNNQIATQFIYNNIAQTSDPQMRFALIQGINQLPYADGDTIAFQYIKDRNPDIARVAALYFFDKGNTLDAKKYFERFLAPETNSACHLELLGAANKFLPINPQNNPLKAGINAILKDSLLRLPDVYRKADIIKYLAGDVTNFTFIRDVTYKAPDKIIQVTGMESYGEILANPSFARIYRSNYLLYKKQIFSYIIEGLLSNDVGLASTAAVILRTPELDFKTFLPSDSIFKLALRKIKLPEGAEAYNEIAKTLSYWNGSPLKPLPDKGFRMLDWAVLNNITDSTKCMIETEKGTITIGLLPSTAPLTVANWIELAKRNYFNNKIFHRVVNNFVIQSGCNRGDGFGAMDYLIRSEFPMVYYDQAGIVGMASAGNNTESAQFFITTLPTPQLDGRYTIFAKLISGSDVAKNIRRGDKINKVTIK